MGTRSSPRLPFHADPSPPLIPIFTESLRFLHLLNLYRSFLLNSILLLPSRYIYIYISSLKKEKEKEGRRRGSRNSSSRRIVRSFGMDIPSFGGNTTTGKYELRGKVAVGRVGHSSSSSPRDDVSRQLY